MLSSCLVGHEIPQNYLGAFSHFRTVRHSRLYTREKNRTAQKFAKAQIRYIYSSSKSKQHNHRPNDMSVRDISRVLVGW